MVVGLIAGDIFPRIQKCSLYSFQCFYFTVGYIGSIFVLRVVLKARYRKSNVQIQPKTPVNLL